jgi:nucleotide-binding universal stress UspA family protein
LAQLARAELVVLHCFPPLDFGLVGADAAVTGWPGYHVEQLASEARTGFERALAGFDWGGVPHTLAFAENDPRAEIQARQDDCQLIVMATHGRSGVRGFLLGDVTYSDMSAAKRPVLALRHPGRAG